jgi:hypothetical protein
VKALYIILTIALLKSLTPVLIAQDSETPGFRKNYLPAQVNLQFAGNIGMFSFGPSWNILGNKAILGITSGFVPKFEAEQAIFITALKAYYTPHFNLEFKNFTIKPLSAGLAFSYTFGNRFNKYQDPNNYPLGYYWWNPSSRFGLLYQAEINTKKDSKFINALSFYIEASIWDLDLYSYFGNYNYSYLKFWDIPTLGAGTKILLGSD